MKAETRVLCCVGLLGLYPYGDATRVLPCSPRGDYSAPLCPCAFPSSLAVLMTRK